MRIDPQPANDPVSKERMADGSLHRSAQLKVMTVWLAMRELIPSKVATWPIQRWRLKHS